MSRLYEREMILRESSRRGETMGVRRRRSRQPGLAAPQGRPINNRPQVTNLPHKIVAAREEGYG